MQTDPTPQHQWLKKFLGEWVYEASFDMGPDAEPMRMSGTESVRAIGDLWVMGEMRGEMPDGSAATMIITVGFDPDAGRFRGTFLGSPHHHLWLYDGRLDEANDELTLEAEGPSMAEPGTLATYRDITRFTSADERRFRSMVRGDDGEWTEFMRSTFTRKA